MKGWRKHLKQKVACSLKKNRGKTKVRKELAFFQEKVAFALNMRIAGGWHRRARYGRVLLETARRGRDCKAANLAWFMSSICDHTAAYVDAFEDIAAKRFYESWCKLEGVEIGCEGLSRNLVDSRFRSFINALQEDVKDWQSLFPYKIFFSPEFIISREDCSLCGKPTGPASQCVHTTGKLYCGRVCYRIVKIMSLRAVSLVLDPVQKYYVARITNDDGTDQFSYEAVQWVRERVANPFDRWEVNHTTRIRPHSEFPDLGLDDDCPCSTGRSYRSCCQRLGGVRTPHMEFWFERQPPAHLSAFTQF